MSNETKRCNTCQQLLTADLTSSICQDCSDKTPRTLVENEDYYIENGLFVFTAKYHKDRGHCCGSGCRHCPY